MVALRTEGGEVDITSGLWVLGGEDVVPQRVLIEIGIACVGGAVGHNSISLIIPCHRVVGTDGSLTGYAGGIDKKIALLELEGADLSNMYAPKKGTAL